MEEFMLSDSDSDEGEDFDVYGADPIFETRGELEQFMATCNIQKTEKDSKLEPSERICYDDQKKIKKNCTCDNCEDIWSEEFQHVCCHQIQRYTVLN